MPETIEYLIGQIDTSTWTTSESTTLSYQVGGVAAVRRARTWRRADGLPLCMVTESPTSIGPAVGVDPRPALAALGAHFGRAVILFEHYVGDQDDSYTTPLDLQDNVWVRYRPERLRRLLPGLADDAAPGSQRLDAAAWGAPGAPGEGAPAA